MSAADIALRLLGRRAVSATRLSGGDLSRVFRLMFEQGDTLIAKQAASASAEADMLRAIRATGAPAPEVYAVTADWLLMEDIAAGEMLGGAWPDLARVLARLHATTGEDYGWPVDHGFGNIRIDNRAAADWPSFWAERRLLCHLPFIRPDLGRRIERLAGRLRDHLPRHPAASLLHGDLWGGNVLVSGDRVAALIDPACYYGHREADVAMLTLFDQPPRFVLDGFALDAGWKSRLPIYRLSPLIVHLRLFGDFYADLVRTALAAVDC